MGYTVTPFSHGRSCAKEPIGFVYVFVELPWGYTVTRSSVRAFVREQRPISSRFQTIRRTIGITLALF